MNIKKHKHLSIEERYTIKEMRDNDKTMTSIGKILNRPKSTISTELKRNKSGSKYMPCVAHKKYKSRLHKEDRLKIEKDSKLLDYIVDGMVNKKWAPDAIAGRLKKHTNLPISISTESIYQFVYRSPIAKKLSLHRYLPSKKLMREERFERRKRVLIPNRTSIHKRDLIASQKIEVGHFEADLTFQKGNQSSNIGCMVDKATQKIHLVLNSSKQTSTVTSGFLRRIKDLPQKARKTFTMDNGKEFVRHVHYQLLGFKTYFCDPYKPRQKALVEKMNSMIHRILPKNIDITTITKETLNAVENILNNMPRKIFGYKTPNEMWAEKI